MYKKSLENLQEIMQTYGTTSSWTRHFLSDPISLVWNIWGPEIVYLYPMGPWVAPDRVFPARTHFCIKPESNCSKTRLCTACSFECLLPSFGCLRSSYECLQSSTVILWVFTIIVWVCGVTVFFFTVTVSVSIQASFETLQASFSCPNTSKLHWK